MAAFAKVQKMAEKLKKAGFKVIGFNSNDEEADGEVILPKNIKVSVPSAYDPAVKQLNKNGRVRYYEEAKTFERLIELLNGINAAVEE